jgi:hypothetical protein
MARNFGEQAFLRSRRQSFRDPFGSGIGVSSCAVASGTGVGHSRLVSAFSVPVHEMFFLHGMQATGGDVA